MTGAAAHPRAWTGRAKAWAAQADGIFVLAAIIVGLAAIAPLLAARFPPLNDYPFHLARIAILANLDHPILDQFYDFGSLLLPNIALDVFAWPLAGIIGAEAALRVFMILSLLLILVGVVSLHAAAFGRLSVWPLLAAPFLYNGVFRFGFLNYIFGLGLALIAAALWIRMGRAGALTPARLAFGFAASILLILCHMSAFGVFATIAGGAEIYRTLGGALRFPGWRPLRALAIAAAPFLAAIGLFWLLSPTSSVEGAAFQYAGYWAAKPLGAAFSLSTGVAWLDAVTALALAAIIAYGFATRRLRAAPALLVAAALLALAIAALPTGLLGSWYADIRLAPALAFLLIAATGLRGEARDARWIAAAAAALALIHAAALSGQWRALDRVTQQIVAGLARVEPGGAVFTAYTDDHAKLIADDASARALWRPPMTHMGAYAVLHAPVFVPMIWTDPKKQPLNVAPAYAEAKALQGNNPFAARTPEALSAAIGRIEDFARESAAPLDPLYLFVTGRKIPNPYAAPPGAEILSRGPHHLLVLINAPDRSDGSGGDGDGR